jgi:hypothetical protein
MSKNPASMATQWKKTAAGEDKDVSICLNCGRKLTLCGRPFTASIPCSKCLYINEFDDSQRPISGHW